MTQVIYKSIGAITGVFAYAASYAAQRGRLSAGTDADAVDPNRGAFQSDLDALVEDGTLRKPGNLGQVLNLELRSRNGGVDTGGEPSH
jgi:hypothetical protein